MTPQNEIGHTHSDSPKGFHGQKIFGIENYEIESELRPYRVIYFLYRRPTLITFLFFLDCDGVDANIQTRR